MCIAADMLTIGFPAAAVGAALIRMETPEPYDDLWSEDCDAVLTVMASLRPTDAQNHAAQAAAALRAYGCELRVRHNTRSVCLILHRSRPPLFVKTEFGHDTATHREVAWYVAVRRTRPDISPFLGGVRADTHATVVLANLATAETFDARALAGKIDEGQVAAAVTAAVHVDKELFEGHRSRRAARGEDVFRQRAALRNREARRLSYLRRLIDAPGHLINGAWLAGPWRWLEHLARRPAAQAYVTSDRYGFIHGDLHGGNILMVAERLHLVDPNGRRWLPLAYDLGKIMHTVHGGYGSIMDGHYQLSVGPAEIMFRWEQPAVLHAGRTALQAQITDRQFAQALYAQAMHFAAMLPHHGTHRRETIALYIRACQTFADLFDVLDVRIPR
ncbi:phosphotransferase [Catellatospora sp. NPDC049111]|uniref:phosphotransferase n=1 Tax=Catellatospora sp. NPDC049111 TaxID=3155271 RepID=UPI0033C4EA53